MTGKLMGKGKKKVVINKSVVNPHFALCVCALLSKGSLTNPTHPQQVSHKGNREERSTKARSVHFEGKEEEEEGGRQAMRGEIREGGGEKRGRQDLQDFSSR